MGGGGQLADAAAGDQPDGAVVVNVILSALGVVLGEEDGGGVLVGGV